MTHIRAAFLASLLGLALSTPQARAEGADCPFVGQLPDFAPTAKAPVWQRYDSHVMFEPASTVERGRICTVSYAKKPAAEAISEIEVKANYEAQLTQEGVEITNDTDGCKIWARVVKETKTNWIEIRCGADGASVTVLQVQPLQNLLLPPGPNDYRLLGHMQGFTPGTPKKIRFDEALFDTAKGKVAVRGAKFTVDYHLPKGGTRTSPIELIGNYQAAFEHLGAEIIYGKDATDPNWIVGRLDDSGRMVWIAVNTGADAYSITTVEEKSFVPTIKPPQAAEMKTALTDKGRIVLYLNFDFNKATLKADAQPVISQIVQLLKDSPDLKVSIEGHTDGVGLHDYNVQLSKDRAATVLAAVTAAGISPARLTSQGFGPDKPLAPDDTDVGRAKNRRVELVKL